MLYSIVLPVDFQWSQGGNCPAKQFYNITGIGLKQINVPHCKVVLCTACQHNGIVAIVSIQECVCVRTINKRSKRFGVGNNSHFCWRSCESNRIVAALQLSSQVLAKIDTRNKPSATSTHLQSTK